MSSSRPAFPLVSCHAQEVTGAGGRADNPFYKVVLVGAVVSGSHSNQQQIRALERKNSLLSESYWFPRRFRQQVVTVERRGGGERYP